MDRVTIETTYRFRYLKNKMKRWVEIRAFGGNFLNFNHTGIYTIQPYAMSLSGTNGQQDLFFENYYFDRNSIHGIWAHQRDENMGGFKSTSFYGGTVTNWMFSTNLYLELPIPKISFIGVFADYGVFKNGPSSNVNSALNTGVGLRIAKVFGLYFPLWMSDEMNDSFGTNYVDKIRFTLKLNPMNKPLKLSSLLG